MKRLSPRQKKTSVLAVLAWALVLASARGARPAGVQDNTRIRPKTDYMSSILSRNTTPIGLRENQTLQKMLRQTNRKWAIRSSIRHILD
jgi:hypothetical protein